MLRDTRPLSKHVIAFCKLPRLLASIQIFTWIPPNFRLFLSIISYSLPQIYIFSRTQNTTPLLNPRLPRRHRAYLYYSPRILPLDLAPWPKSFRYYTSIR